MGKSDLNNSLVGRQTTRITIRIPEEMLTEIEKLVEAGEFENKTQAIRDEAIQSMLEDRDLPEE